MLFSHSLKQTLFLRYFGLTKVYLLWWLRPKVVELSQKRCEICIPLSWRSRNHLRSMYFGALCIGADCAGGLLAYDEIQRSKEPVQFVFKSLKADFLKRAESDVYFCCEDGEQSRSLVAKARSSQEREEAKVLVTAYTRGKEELKVAEFTLVISVRARK